MFAEYLHRRVRRLSTGQVPNVVKCGCDPYLRLAALAFPAVFFSGASSQTILETILALCDCTGTEALTCGPLRNVRELRPVLHAIIVCCVV